MAIFLRLRHWHPEAAPDVYKRQVEQYRIDNDNNLDLINTIKVPVSEDGSVVLSNALNTYSVDLLSIKPGDAKVTVDTSKNGLAQDENGNWYYYKNGVIDTSYTGIAPNAYGWWRVVNGAVDFNCNSVEANEYGWFCIRGGKVDFDYTGIAQNAYGWWRIVNGAVDFNCNSVEANEYGWFYLRGGKVDLSLIHI